MSSSNCCFLTCIQISQEAGQIVWYSPVSEFSIVYCSTVYCDPHSQRLWHSLKTEVDVFLELSCFFNDPADVGDLISGPLPFLKPAWTSGSSRFTYCWSLAWRILSITLQLCNCVVVWAFFGIAFLWDWDENWPFPVLWPLLSFPNLLAYWVQRFHSIIIQDLK